MRARAPTTAKGTTAAELGRMRMTETAPHIDLISKGPS
jgi:hypothetical protein